MLKLFVRGLLTIFVNFQKLVYVVFVVPLIKFHTKQKNGYWVDILRMAENQILQLSGLENPTKQEGIP